MPSPISNQPGVRRLRGVRRRPSNVRFWEPPVRPYVEELVAGRDGPRGKDFNMRWVASMVADVFRLLEVMPTSLHQRVPAILGSANEVERVTGYHA